MIAEILFISVDQMSATPASDDVVVISILDASEENFRPNLIGFKEFLNLQFEDTGEEMFHADPGAWPDDPDDVDHAIFSQGRGEKIPSLTDARKIVEFINKHQQSDEEVTLIAHCFAGISRSAAVASWASSKYQIPIVSMSSPEYANQRLIRLMHKADDEIYKKDRSMFFKK
jgi:predicted protein tyrosine phosphatase